jgi:hypothetical protein
MGTCANCGRETADGVETTINRRVACASCGSKERTAIFPTTVSASAALRAVSTLTIASGASARITVVAPADDVVALSDSVEVTIEQSTTTSLGAVVDHRVDIRSGPWGDTGLMHVELVRDGRPVASGLGDSFEDALMALIMYLLPPSDPDYPKPPADE